MLDWKILAASFAALLFVSSMLVGDFAIRDLFTTVSEQLGEWLGNSPFGGMFTATKPQVTDADVIDLEMRPETFTLIPDQPVNISFDSGEITDFSGSIDVNYETKVIILDETNSDLIIKMPLETIKISGLSITKMDLKDIDLDLTTGSWDLTSKNGSIEIHGFLGTGEITPSMIIMQGNVTKLVRL